MIRSEFNQDNLARVPETWEEEVRDNYHLYLRFANHQPETSILRQKYEYWKLKYTKIVPKIRKDGSFG